MLLTHLGLETVVRVSRSGAAPGSSFYVRCAHADPRLGVFRLDEVSVWFVRRAVALDSSVSGPSPQAQRAEQGLVWSWFCTALLACLWCAHGMQ